MIILMNVVFCVVICGAILMTSEDYNPYEPQREYCRYVAFWLTITALFLNTTLLVAL